MISAKLYVILITCDRIYAIKLPLVYRARDHKKHFNRMFTLLVIISCVSMILLTFGQATQYSDTAAVCAGEQSKVQLSFVILDNKSFALMYIILYMGMLILDLMGLISFFVFIILHRAFVIKSNALKVNCKSEVRVFYPNHCVTQNHSSRVRACSSCP